MGVLETTPPIISPLTTPAESIKTIKLGEYRPTNTVKQRA